MKNTFNKLLSYITDVSLETASSHLNPYLEVLLVNGRHQLITEDAIYSFEDKYENFYDSFKKLNWSVFKPQNVLVLGLGLGSVIYMLEKNFGKNLEYKAVEIDAEIIKLAHKYTLSGLNSFVEVIETDALHFVNIDRGKYDLILVDIFQSSKIPREFQSLTFMEKLKELMSDESLLIYNRMHLSTQDRTDNKDFKNHFESLFNKYETLRVKDNLIYFSDTKFLA